VTATWSCRHMDCRSRNTAPSSWVCFAEGPGNSITLWTNWEKLWNANS